MNHKYEILKIHDTDNFSGRELIGKIGIGNLKKHPAALLSYYGYSQGGLDLSFRRKVPSRVSILTSSGRRKMTDGPDKYVQSTEYLYFSAVKLRKVGN